MCSGFQMAKATYFLIDWLHFNFVQRFNISVLKLIEGDVEIIN